DILLPFGRKIDFCTNRKILSLSQLGERLFGQTEFWIIKRNHSAIGMIMLHLSEHLRHVSGKGLPDARATFASLGLMGRRAGRPQTGDGDILLQSERSRHDLAINGPD